MQPALVNRFRGLNNTDDSVRLGLSWQSQADNLLVTNDGALMRRNGYTLAAAGAFTGAYSMRDYTRMYVVNGTDLQRVAPDLTLTTIRSGLQPLEMHWTEVNKDVYFTNGVDSGIVHGDDSVTDWSWPAPTAPTLARGQGSLPAGLYRAVTTYLLPDGRETGSSTHTDIELPEDSSLLLSDIPITAGVTTLLYISPADSPVFGFAGVMTSPSYAWSAGPDSLGAELTNLTLNPLPPGAIYPTAWKGRIYAAQHSPQTDTTAVWFSEPLGFHLFALEKNFFQVPGMVTMMAPAEDALVVATHERIYAYADSKLEVLAEYGAPPGNAWAMDDDDSVLFWSKRGVCRAMPFMNLTEDRVSVAPGAAAGAALLRHKGQKHFIATLRLGGAAFNNRS